MSCQKLLNDFLREIFYLFGLFLVLRLLFSIKSIVFAQFVIHGQKHNDVRIISFLEHSISIISHRFRFAMKWWDNFNSFN